MAPHLNFPPPSDEQAFERLVEELATPVLNARTVELNGRKGQSQQGVDVSASLYDGTQVGIQCKLTGKALKVATVTEEIAKARSYRPPLDRFIVATTARSDARLQEQVRSLPSESFSVEIWSWDQINGWLNRYAAAGLSYVQHVLLGATTQAEHAHADALRVALDRPALVRSADTEHNFADQFDAIKDTSTFLRTGYLYTRDGHFVVGVLPLRNYSDDYVALVSPVLRALDALDRHLRRRISDLLDPSSPRHAEAAARLDTKRIAVLTAGNKVFATLDIDLVPIGR
ncbi:MAG: hypothetical protein ACOYX5_15990 [Actinomycetota bacterium]